MLKKQPERAMELIFRHYYGYVCKRILRVVHQESLSEDIAQEVFMEVWKKRKDLVIRTTFKAYLGRAGVNRALNHLRNNRPELFAEQDALEAESTPASVVQEMEAKDLRKQIDKAIEGLPERCRLVFSLSRFEHLTNKQIAAQLEISEKTVENQMTKALRFLRGALEGYGK